MRFGEAFTALGYALTAPRTDWTAISDDGVCISLWRSEVDWTASPPFMDSRIHGGPLEDWIDKPGNRKRRRHIAAALELYGGWVDAVIVDGKPGKRVTNAVPWKTEARNGCRWRVTYFDPATGHLAVEMAKL